MSILNFYRERVTEIFNELSKKSSFFLVFFKGFPSLFYDQLELSAYFGLKESRYDNKYGYIDPIKLYENKNHLMMKFLSTSESGLWGYYEEFVTLTNSLSNIKELFDGDIYIS